MKLRLYILFLLCLTSVLSFGQNDNSWHSTVYVEAGGPGPIVSINLEHYSIEKEKFKIGARFGLGTSGFRDFTNEMNPDFYIPFGGIVDIDLFQHNKNKLLLNVGVGLIYASVVHANSQLLPEREKKLNPYGQLAVSYVIKGKLMTRIAYTPIFSSDVGLNHWGGISIGYSF